MDPALVDGFTFDGPGAGAGRGLSDVEGLLTLTEAGWGLACGAALGFTTGDAGGGSESLISPSSRPCSSSFLGSGVADLGGGATVGAEEVAGDAPDDSSWP